VHDPSQHERNRSGPTGALSPRRRRPALVVGAAILVAGLAVVGLAWLLTQGLIRPERIVVERSPLLDRPAPAFALQSLDGGTVRLADYRGRPVIVNFWASWCVPCREEFPLFRDARGRYSGEGLEILGIVHDDGPAEALAFAQALGADWPLLLDPDDIAWRAYGGVFLPVTYYIDRDGIVRAVSYGPPPRAVFDEQIQKILQAEPRQGAGTRDAAAVEDQEAPVASWTAAGGSARGRTKMSISDAPARKSTPVRVAARGPGSNSPVVRVT
jgi:cytochrome c biogenesis protein CcmG, thiol:disulfide interchange protein DsbE